MTGGVETLLETGYYRLIRGRHGLFLVNPKDIYIGRSLIEYGEYSELEASILAQLLRPGGMAVELGAHMGALTVPMARRVGRSGLVWAFEPQPLVFQLLAANLALNDLLSAVPVAAAAGGPGDGGHIPLARLDPGQEDNSGGIPLSRISQEDSPVRVEVIPLDRAIDPPRLDLIKADVEGMEQAALEGAAGLIARHRPALYVENHYEEGSAALIGTILGMDYRLWWHLPPLFNPENFAGREENVFGRLRSINMIALPAERRTEVTGFREVSGPEDHPRKWGG